MSQRLALYCSSIGNYFFQEIRDLIAAGLAALNNEVELLTEANGFSPRADWHLVIAPHEFFELGKGAKLARLPSPKNLVLFNTEQPSTQWFKLAAQHFPRAAALWDIDFESSLRISKSGYPCRYLPLGYVPGFSMFQPVNELPRHGETQALASIVCSGEFLYQPYDTRPLDLLFLGHGSARREQFFADHSRSLSKHLTFSYRPTVQRPLIPGQTTSMNTATSIGLGQRTRILLNVHHGVDKYFEWHRIVLLGIAQRALVLSEPCSIAPPFQANVDYVEAPLDELPDRIDYFLRSADGRREAQALIEHAYATLTQRCRLSEALRPLLTELQRGSDSESGNLVHLVPAEFNVTPEVPSLSTCVVTPVLSGVANLSDAGSAQVALAETLASQGKRVTILHTSPYTGGGSPGSWAVYFAQRNIRYVQLPAEPALPVEAPPAAALAYGTYRWLLQHQFDVVHLPETEGIGLYALLARNQGLAFEHTRFCVNVHAPREWRRQANETLVCLSDDLERDFMERDCVRLADAVVTSTQFMLDWMEQRGWVLPPERSIRPDAPKSVVALHSERRSVVRTLAYVGAVTRSSELELFCQAIELLAPASRATVQAVFMCPRSSAASQREYAYLRRRVRLWKNAWEIVEYESEHELFARLQQPDCLTIITSPQLNSPALVRQLLQRGARFLASDSGGVTELLAASCQKSILFRPKPSALATTLAQILSGGAPLPEPALDLAQRHEAWVRWHKHWSTSVLEHETSSATPLVSVCLVHYNRPDYLRQALASLRTQDYPNFEVVLVDDGSTSAEAVRLLTQLQPEFSQRGWQIVRQANRYLGAARNTGARHARGEFIIFMDDDNVAKPHEVSTFVRIALRTGADILTSAMDQFTGTAAPDATSKPRSRWIFLGAAAAPGAIRNCFGDANGCIRREAFWRVGGFTEDYGITHEDWEFYARAVLQGCRLETIPEALFWYRVSPGSMIRGTSAYANQQRSLRPFLAAVPEPLHGLLHLLQGTVSSEPWNVKVADYRDLLALHQTLLSAGIQIYQLGQTADAESIFTRVLQSSEALAHGPLHVRTLMSVAITLARIGKVKLADGFLERAGTLAAMLVDEVSKADIRTLQEALKAGSDLEAAASGINLFEAESPPAGAALGNTVSDRSVSVRPHHPAPVNGPCAVSIIIPVLNNLGLTKQCIEAIAKVGSLASAEVVVVDNGSTDDTPKYLSEAQQKGRLRYLRNESNQGFAYACNQGAALARAKILIFLNNDTIPFPGWLDALLAAAKPSEVGIVGAKLLYPNGTIQHAGIGWINGVPDHPERHAPSQSPEVNTPRELDMVTGACLLIARDLFLKLGGFDEVFRNGVEDIDLCLRVRAAGLKVLYEPKSVLYHLEGQSTGRFAHVDANLRLFFTRWRKQFDAAGRYIQPAQSAIIPAEKSNIAPPRTISVDWTGSFAGYDSLSGVNRSFAAALRALPRIRLSQVEVAGEVTPSADAADRRDQPVASDSMAEPLVTIRHQWPPDWGRSKQGSLVVMQPWEFGSLPKEWVAQAANVDEFWAYTDYVRQVYVSSGIAADKVKVVPLGIDPATFRPDATPRSLATTKRFKFLFVGGTIHRKGPDVLLSAYIKSFTATDDVCLVIKDFGGNTVYAGQTLGDKIRQIQDQPNAPEILYLDEELPVRALPSLYTACDCLVHPYRGEGFGLPILEAMACGLPVIVTAGGSADDFATDEFAYRIPATRKSIGRSISGLPLVDEGWLLEPDCAALAERMRWITTHQVEAHILGAKASEQVRKQWTWERAAAVAEARLCELARGTVPASASTKTTAAHKPAPQSSPEAAKRGELAPAEELFRKKSPRAAWESACLAIQARPFHPEAFLLLAEIARLLGDGASAKRCARHAAALAPSLKAAKKLLKQEFKGATRPDWLVLPDVFSADGSLRAPRLSVCLIAKNEEKFLGQCLASVKGLADQIVVVDTGSTDRTIDVAREHGAEVHSFAWCDDFSAARNAALEHATGDWVLVLDADEELPAASHEKLRAHLRDAAVMAWRLPIVDAGREEAGHSYVPRLFRNAPGLFFAGRVHEHAFGVIEQLRKTWGLDNRLGEALIVHHGYTKAVTEDRDKVARNLRLLELALQESPNNVSLLMSLGLELCRSKRLDEGLLRYHEAFTLLAAQPTSAVVPELRETLLTQFASYLFSAKRHSDAVTTLTSPLARQAQLTASQCYVLGMAQIELEQHAEAAEQMRQCLARRSERSLMPALPEVCSSAPRRALALCLWRLKGIDAADKEFQQALVEEPHSPTAHIEYAKFLSNTDRIGDALQLLHKLVSEKPDLVAVWNCGAQLALSQPDLLDISLDWTSVAIQHHSDNPEIIAQRAETLMLAAQFDAALPLWQTLAANNAPRAQAAVILCEAAMQRSGSSTGLSPAVDQEFARWFQRLVDFKAEATIRLLISEANAISAVLPTAGNILKEIAKELAQTRSA